MTDTIPELQVLTAAQVTHIIGGSFKSSQN